MGNKYNSNLRTYTARNLMWNCDASSGLGQPVIYTMNAPNVLTIKTANNTLPNQNSFLPQLYQAQMPLRTDWNKESYIKIKRAGIFSNFADGLIQSLDKTRIKMNITVQICDFVKTISDTVFTANSNIISSADFGTTAYPSLVADGYDPTPGLPASPSVGDQYWSLATANGWIINYAYRWTGTEWMVLVRQYDVIFDEDLSTITDPTLNAYGYVVKNPQSATAGLTYLTDYAFRDTTNSAGRKSSVYRSNRNKRKTFTLNNIPTLNSLYETEIFFPYVPSSLSEVVLISCSLSIDNESSQTLDFLTDSINPAFNGRAVSFDSVIEVEVTPS